MEGTWLQESDCFYQEFSKEDWDTWGINKNVVRRESNLQMSGLAIGGQTSPTYNIWIFIFVAAILLG
jgi:hypothetical protein